MTLATEAVSLPTSGLVFINSYGASVSDAYRAAIVTAENYLQLHFTNQVTISIDFDQQSLGAGVAAQNSYSTIKFSYSALSAALQGHAVTKDDHLAVSGLPAADPSSGAGFGIPVSQAIVLGLAAQTNVRDVTVTLNSDLAWTYGQDAVGAIIHEITEGGFGRVSTLGLDTSSKDWGPLDLFRFTAAGQRDYTGGSDGITTFFGLDANHVSALPYHSGVSATGVRDSNDLGDWGGTRGDSFGPGGPTSPGSVSVTDLQVLDVLGWTPTTAAAFAPAADDFADSLGDVTHPMGQLTPGSSATGTLQVAGDRDWFRLQTRAGFAYTVSEIGHAGGGGTLGDPFLRVHDATGAVVSSNDDIVDGTNPDSRLTFTATTNGVYYVEAGAYVDGYAGSYRLDVTQTVNLPSAITTAITSVLRAAPTDASAASLSSDLSVGLTAGTLTQGQAINNVVHAAAATSSVATLAYEFFTGAAPSAAGMDFLVSPTGPNPNNLNSAYYQSFGLENRYINFASNLGRAGAGSAQFAAHYGSLSPTDAMTTAYTTIFGGAPSADKVSHLLNDLVPNGLGGSYTRLEYFQAYGGDGPTGVGTKAAMVGWLLSEAVKADVGTYALSNDAFLTDVAQNNAPFAVDIVGHYSQSGFVFHPG